MNVEITALAEANLKEIYLRIRKDAPSRAVEWREGLLKAAQTLERFPRRCPLAAESGAELEIRQLVYGAYRLLFTIAKGHGLRAAHSPRRAADPETGRDTN